MERHKVIAEDFPIFRTMFENVGFGKCDATRHIVYQSMMKHFEPVSLTGLESRPDGEFRSEMMRHIAQKYTFKSRTIVIDVESQAQGYEVEVGDGIKLIFRFVEPMKRGAVKPTTKESWLYLIFLYRTHKNNVCPFKKVRQFLDYLHEMEECPIDVMFYRPHGIQEWSHFQSLDMIEYPNATTERLKRAYQYKWKSKPMDVLDQTNQPYWQIPNFIP